MGSQSRVGDGTNRKMKIQILGLIFVGLLPFLVSGAAKPNDGHIMRFGRSEGDQIDEESNKEFNKRPFQLSRIGRSENGQMYRFGRSEKDQVLRFGRSENDQKNRHIMRFGRSVMDQNDMFMRALRSPGTSDMFMRALRSGRADMLMRALRSSDMLMRALRSNDGMARDLRGFGGSSNDMFMRALREDPSIMSDAIENADN